MESKPKSVVKLPMRPQKLYQLRTTGRIWPRRVAKLRLHAQHSRRLQRTGRIIPRSMPPDQNFKTEVHDVKIKDQRSKSHPSQRNLQASEQRESAWIPQMRPMPPHSRPQPPQHRGRQPKRPPRDSRHILMREKLQDQMIQQHKSQIRPGPPWILQSPAGDNSDLLAIPQEKPGPQRDQGRRVSLQRRDQVFEVERDPDVDMEDADPLDADVMHDLFGSWEMRRAQAIADGMLVNLQLQFGRDSHSWQCRACDTMVDGSQESHMMWCKVAWGHDASP